MKTSRLFEIVYILLNKEKVTAKDLADHFEVSTRTIYRDVEDLSASGIPIYMTKGKNGGIALLPDYVLNKTLLSENDKTNILSAIQGLHSLDESSMVEVFSKLSSFFGDKEGYFEIDYSDWGSLTKNQLDKAKQAILQNKHLSFDYISSQNKLSKRLVEPYKLWFKDRTWYLKAFCTDKNELRLFRFSRMRQVTIEKESFIPRKLDFSLPFDRQNSYPTIEIVLRVESSMEYRIWDEFQEEDIVKNEDGSFTIRMNQIENDWLYGYILSFGASATVIEPPRIRRLIKDSLKKSIENYL